MSSLDINSIAKFLIFYGLLFLIIGSSLYFLSKMGIGLGKLPGDILIQKKNFTFYFPLATSILISIVFTLLIGLFQKK